MRLVEPVAPIVESTTVPAGPEKPKRLYLTPGEVEALIKSAEKRGRYGVDDLHGREARLQTE